MIVRRSAPDRFLGRAAQIVDLLDQMFQVQLVITAGAQELGLRLAPDIEILIVKALHIRLVRVAIGSSSVSRGRPYHSHAHQGSQSPVI